MKCTPLLCLLDLSNMHFNILDLDGNKLLSNVDNNNILNQ